MEEKRLQDIIKNNEFNSQKQILEILDLNEDDIYFNAEEQIPNGMYADFSLIKGDKLYALIELKGTIGVNDYVRGTGQLVQYDYYIKNDIKIKNYDMSQAITIFIFPESLIQSHQYNIGLFSYPRDCILITFNEENNTFRKITKKELEVFAGSRGKAVVTISPYYIRDTRIFEIYLALKYFQINKLLGKERIKRKDAEIFLKNLEVPDNGNWRNVFIALSSLALIDDNNLPTFVGSTYANLDYEDFAFEVYNSYIRNYCDTILKIILQRQPTDRNMSLGDIKNDIDSMYGNREVLFLTDSNNRYLSSWLNIMRDDFGAISFQSGKNKRIYTINYEISKYNKDAIKKEIKQRSIAYSYIKKLEELIKI